MLLLNKQEVSSELRYSPTGQAYLENQALHYLCRNKDLENVSVKRFYELYEERPMKSVTGGSVRRTDEEKWPFMADTRHFVHPSAIKGNDGVLTGETSAGVILRKEEALVRVPQWAFSDAGGFGANILTCPTGELNQAMDTYAEVLLALYLPHRCLADLKKSVPQTNYAFAERLREVYEYDVLRKANKKNPSSSQKEPVIHPEHSRHRFQQTRGIR
ncbi:hypothetical protein SEMRO_1747_G295080.1 [Seminavis robusta]|uniref:Uncharacterized protein n=1 Tax=Seminavis robusta TaxID=568900 RepID=A0A9N8HX43_9STRA|nr:hypothetical protein SEMRO_1747_G295080.1 [Seminavis robusta]|eukprot:Sro1747_g295080.1 n/a (216) ;mRNA; r:22200-22847